MKTNKTTSRSRIVEYLDAYLRISSIPDKSLNGLQVQGKEEVRRIAFAVDACLATIRAAARRKADMLVVHHGLFWSQRERITGLMHKRIAALVENKMSLYAAHLPLDCHEEVGNNVELIRLLGLRPDGKFGQYQGTEIGYLAQTVRPLTRADLVKRLEKVLNTSVDVLTFGPARVRKIAVISGSAAEFAGDASEAGCDTLITGERSHIAFHLAKEGKINLIYGGHYATETVGVKALARHLAKNFSLDCRFISAPTGY